MTQEEKDLLLKDLCARLPYEVKGVITYNGDKNIFTLKGISKKLLFESAILFLSDAECCHVEDFKPYLRSMSSMTEKEYEELRKIDRYYGIAPLSEINDWEPGYKSIDWLLRHHFDFRGLIPKGLAIEATEGMY